MVLYNLYLVLTNEAIKVYDNQLHTTVYEGSSEDIPEGLFNKLVHDVMIVQDEHINGTYLLININ